MRVLKKISAYRNVLAALMLCFAGMIPAQRCAAQETDYKAYTLFIYNFIKYIVWPEAPGEFVIGVMGTSPISGELKTLAATKKAHGKTIVIKTYATAAEIGNCQLLYIPPSKSALLPEILEKTKTKATLVVCEREGLAKKGAGINFTLEEDDVLKFEVNKKVIEARSMKVPALLLTLGYEVG